MKKLILAILLVSFSLPSTADSISWQDYTIHYTSLNSMLIPGEVAAAHGIVRSKRRTLTNITIRQNKKAVRAHLSGTTRNLLGQLFTMRFDEVIEPGAIYYLSNQIIDERDTLMFTIDVTPENNEDTFHLTFKRQYH